MITTKAGAEVVILEGSKKSIRGTKPFLVKFTNNPFPVDKNGIPIFPERFSNHWYKPFKAQRHELVYQDEAELINALNKN